MDFNFSDDQRQLANAVRRFIDRSYTFDSRRNGIQAAPGYSEAAWKTLVELGLTALPIPEAQGGFDGTAVDMMVVMQELGRGLLVEPYIATMIGAYALRLAGSQETSMARVARGDLKLAAAFHEYHARHDFQSVRVTASNGELNGKKTIVSHGGQADKLIVSARHHGTDTDPCGISLYLVDSTAPGLTIADYRTIDNLRAADITFQNTPGILLGESGGAWPLVERITDYAALLLCSEAIGIIDALNAATFEYAKARRQFGAPIASFQALRHRMVDMTVHAEISRALTMLTAARFDAASDDERRRLVSAMKARVGLAARAIGQEAIQIHGGIGVTNELPAAHMFKRLTMLNTAYGDVDHHLSRFAFQTRQTETA